MDGLFYDIIGGFTDLGLEGRQVEFIRAVVQQS